MTLATGRSPVRTSRPDTFVDVIARTTDVSSLKETVGVETVIARRVACSLRTFSEDNARIGLMLGLQTADATATFGAAPRIESGYQLRINGTTVRYTVKSVTRYPTPHNYTRQRCMLGLDQTTGAP